MQLALPGLPAYPEVEFADLAVAEDPHLVAGAVSGMGTVVADTSTAASATNWDSVLHRR
mgnify:CR=1 FL=1